MSDTQHYRFQEFTEFLQRRGRLVLAVTALLMIGSVMGIVQLNIDTRFDVFMPPDSASRDAMTEMTAAFGDGGQLVALVETSHDQAALADLVGLTEELSAISGVASAEPPLPKGVLSLSSAMFEMAKSRLSEITGGATLPTHEGQSYAVFRLMMESGTALQHAVDRIETTFADAGKTVLLSGEPYLEAKVFDYVLRILLFLPPAAVLLMLLVFRLRIGSARATILSMVPAIVGAAITLGAVAWFAGSVSVVSALVPIFVIVLGSADGLHLTSHVMDELGAGATNTEAVAKTLRAVGVPIIVTTVTTMAGFLSLLTINSAAIRGLAVSAAAGVFVAGVATWFILPALLLKQRPLQRAKRGGPGLLDRVFSRMCGWPALILVLVLIVGFIPGARMLRANFSMIDVYKPSTEVRQNLYRVGEVMGGSIPVYLSFDAEEPYDPELARAVLSFHERVEETGIVSHSVSLYRTVERAMEMQTGTARYPDSAAEARAAVEMIRSASPGFLDTFVAESGLGRAVFFLSDLDNTTLQTFRDAAQAISEHSGFDFKAVGAAFVMKEMNDQIIPQQVGSLLLAAAVVLVLSTLAQRSLGLGAASTVPILVTLLVVFGVMGYASIDLSIITGIMSGLTVGVGIDYAIHYVSLFKQARMRGSSDPAGEALSYVATPVVANALGLAVGFTAMALSPLQIHVTLSILMWVTMAVSALVTLTLLPTITGWRHRHSAKRPSRLPRPRGRP
ncbi:MAG: MMPL family transporter [Spirochaetes bacterium]|jgi:predicted RND superfamily exporter protein|nr:MMPL family transporter [Spirochaetota bacterium]